MAAAGWTVHARDITHEDHTWGDYLTVGQLMDAIRKSEGTIRDLLTRKCAEDDPRWAIRWPAARIGGSPAGVGAEPMWSPEQAREYKRREGERREERRREIEENAKLPVISTVQAVDQGLATMQELTDIVDRPKSALSRWMRESRGSDRPFPPKLGIAERTPPISHMGPPRPLYKIADVQKWIRDTECYEASHGGGRGRRRQDIPVAV